MVATPDLDPADAEHRRDLYAQMRRHRETAGLSSVTIDRALGHERGAVSRAERDPNPNPRLRTLQAHARAVGHTAVPQLHGVDIPDTPSLALLEAMTRSADPAYADAAARSLIVAELAAARRWQRRTLADVAAAMGSREGPLSSIETERYEVLVKTLQRYARALGGYLTVDLTPTRQPALEIPA